MLQSGYPARNPLFRVADGYLAEYLNARIVRVFSEEEGLHNQVNDIEQACIARTSFHPISV